MWIQACDFMRHLKAHSGERSNKCNQCDFAFIQAGNLRPHVKAHSGEKPNKCNRCDFTPKGRQFKESFEDTTTTHSEEKP